MRPLTPIIIFSLFLSLHSVYALEIISKSNLEKCEKVSGSSSLNCTSKIVIDMAVPSESSGREASIVAKLVEVEENSTNNMQTLRKPPVITVNKSAAYALYELTYIRDVPYKPEEYYVRTRKCEPDAGADVVQICERLRDEKGHIVEHSQPTCCPCGDQRRMPSSCGNFFDKMMKGKANTAHCLRFPGDWFHVFGIGQRTIGFSVRIEVKTESKVSEVVLGPENRTVTSSDNFLRVNLIGDYNGYTNIPSFEDYYLVIPRQGGPGQPPTLGNNFSKWMLLERVRFTLDGFECNKIGVGYEAFNGQPDFCSSPFWSCLHNQLWNFWDADQSRMGRNQVPLYGVQGRFERINQHPNAGSLSFSIGITEVLNTNLLIELSADDIEYVSQRSPGKITSVSIQTFEALTQVGTAVITTQNVGEVEASYSLTFDCSTGISQMQEQFYILKPKEVANRSFKLYPTTDQASKYACAAILKDSGYSEVDRSECQFTTTATALDNGSQIPFQPPKTSINGFFETIESMWNNFWNGLANFFTGKACRRQCTGFFDFSCHVQYVCISWLLMFGLLLAIFPTVIVLIWLLHQKGLFDPLYDWWEDHFWDEEQRTGDIPKHGIYTFDPHEVHLKKHQKHEVRHHRRHDAQKTRKRVQNEHRHHHSERDNDYHYYLHHVHKDKHKHRRMRSLSKMRQVHAENGDEEKIMRHRRHKKDRETIGISNITGHVDESSEDYYRHNHGLLDDKHYKHHANRIE